MCFLVSGQNGSEQPNLDCTAARAFLVRKRTWSELASFGWAVASASNILDTRVNPIFRTPVHDGRSS
jgi:hypothetical protein